MRVPRCLRCSTSGDRPGPLLFDVALVLEGRGIMRAHQVVDTPAGPGEVTSGGFSPTAGVSIALARIPRGDFDRVEIQIRNKNVPARVVKAPFVRNGKILIDLPEASS